MLNAIIRDARYPYSLPCGGGTGRAVPYGDSSYEDTGVGRFSGLADVSTCPGARGGLASPRTRGEAGLHRRCNPGEGNSPRTELVESSPLPAHGERGRTARVAQSRVKLQ